ncbi:AI-2E family transporter [Pelagibacterium montanilacus]|uniref:AI-2E family transporter n=1 Tax=Pelagibacterium montanilacus TaxID=2185280 RepID=UPI000F8F07A1|nr:AI-2E family transporter [Pelagibacterium montanilacus]
MTDQAPVEPVRTHEIKKSWHLAFALAVLAAVMLLVWQLSLVLLLAFTAMIVATIIRGTARLFMKATPMPEKGALACALIAILLVVSGFLFLLGGQVQTQFIELTDRLPDLINEAGEVLNMTDAGDNFMEMLPDLIEPSALAGGIGMWLGNMAGVVSALVLVIVAGIYLALSPRTYWSGTLLLIPPRYRETAEDTMNASARALRLWLLGQFAAMVAVGVTVTIAMLALGVPSALAIGVIAGVLEFIPFLGPILAAIPAILVALAEGDNLIYWVLGTYIVIQQIEGNVLVPLIQDRAVKLPPVLGLFTILIFGILFGPIGIILATPLTIVTMVFVKKLYVEDHCMEPESAETDLSLDGGKKS